MHKKGLSDIVTTVLVILVALAAVVIIWNFIQPFLSNAGIDTQALTSQLTSPDAQASFDGSNVSIRVSRNAGDGDIVGFLVGLEGTSGVKTFRQNLTINQLETAFLNVNYTDQFSEDILSVTVTPIFKNNNTGKEIIGQPITTKPAKYKLPSGLIAHWKFEENYVDSSGNNLLGTGAGGLSFPDGKKGKGLQCNGDTFTYVQVSNNILLNPTEMTVVAWIRPTTLPTNTKIMTKSDTISNNGWNLEYDGSSKWRFKLFPSSSQSIFDSSPTIGVWGQVIGVYAGNTVKIYYNGQLKQSVSASTFALSIANLQICRSYNGIVDEAMIFNRGLSDSEIKALYNAYK